MTSTNLYIFKNTEEIEEIEEPVILFNKLRVGAHVEFSGSLALKNTLEVAVRYGMECVQFFMGNPKSLTRSTVSDRDISICNDFILSRFPLDIFTHFPYIANLNGSAQCLAWSCNPVIDEKTTNTILSIKKELDTLNKLKIGEGKKCGIVIHPGCFYGDRNEGLKCIARTINKINFGNGQAKLLLENCAGEGKKLCKTFEEIAEVIKYVDDKKHIGVCLDTAHIWGQGDYDLRDCDEVKRMFSEFNKIIGIEYLSLIHLNDSKVALGSKKDRHELIGRGEIWSKNNTSLLTLLSIAKEEKIPCILETHKLDMLTLVQLTVR